LVSITNITFFFEKNIYNKNLSVFLAKPSNVNEFFTPFSNELKIKLKNSIIIDKKIINFELSQIICDALTK